MYTFTQITQKIELYISEYEFETLTPELYEPISYTISQSGKKIRPTLVALCCNIFKDDIDDVWPAAYAIEMFHNFTLLHDDIMDESLLRRNMPTVHAKWGANSAILSGDAMLIESYKLLSKIPAAILPAALEIFNTTARGVCEGQQLDMAFENRDDVELDEYLKMIGLKTAVLLEGAMQIGALMGGANSEQAQKLAQYGYSVGLAFQIQDDVLDLYGDPKSFGKPIGGDIKEGKKSYLLLKALELSSADKASELKILINNKELDPQQKINQVRAIYDSLNIQDIATDAVEDMFAQADQILNESDIETSKLEQLRSFIEQLKNRNK